MLRTRASAQLWEARVSAAADRHTMDHLGVPSPILMERAALVVSHEIVELCATEALPVLVLVGPGNNGGDGLAVARQLHGWGIRVHAILATRKHNDAVQQQLAISRAVGVPVEDHVPAQPPHSQHLVVDALLGTGSKG